MRAGTFHNHSTLRTDFLDDRFAHMRRFMIEIRKQHLKILSSLESFITIFDKLRNFHLSYYCDFKVNIKEKPENYGLLFLVLADGTDCYASRVISHVTPLINNLQEKGNIHDLIIKIMQNV